MVEQCEVWRPALQPSGNDPQAHAKDPGHELVRMISGVERGGNRAPANLQLRRGALHFRREKSNGEREAGADDDQCRPKGPRKTRRHLVFGHRPNWDARSSGSRAFNGRGVRGDSGLFAFIEKNLKSARFDRGSKLEIHRMRIPIGGTDGRQDLLVDGKCEGRLEPHKRQF